MFDPEGLDRAAERFEQELERHLEQVRAVRTVLQGLGTSADLENGLRKRLRLVADGASAAGHILKKQVDADGEEVPTAEEILGEDAERADGEGPSAS